MRAYIVPVGLFTDRNGICFPVAFMQRKDHAAPGPYCDKLAAIGGLVEGDEAPAQAARRELEEEVPGWYAQARLPGTSGGYCGLAAVDGLIEILSTGQIVVYATMVDVGVVSARLYSTSTLEGLPAILNEAAIKALANDRWVIPAMKAPLLKHLAALRGAVERTG